MLVRPEDVRQKAPGRYHCVKCSSDRIHVSVGGTRSLPIAMRLVFVLYRCHTCGHLTRHLRFLHWIRNLFGTARRVSMSLLQREQPVESQAEDFKPVKRDRAPVLRQPAGSRPPTTAAPALNVELKPDFDLEPIVKDIKAHYTTRERELMASKFHEMSVLIAPPQELPDARQENLSNHD